MDDQKRLIERAQAGDQAARTQLVTAHLPWLRRVCRRWQGQGLDLDDLTQEAVLGLLRAIDEYDLDSSASLKSYALFWVKDSLSSAIADGGTTIAVPKHVRTEIRRAQRGEIEADDQLRQHASIAYVRLDAPSDEHGNTNHEMYGRDEGDPDVAALDVESLLTVLTDRERQIVQLYYAGDEQSYERVSKQVGLGPDRVKQIITQALEKLRRAAQ